MDSRRVVSSAPSRAVAALRIGTLAAAAAFAACQPSSPPPQGRALVVLQEGVKRDTGLHASVSLPDDSTLALEVEASSATRAHDRRGAARRIAMSAARHWPDPGLRRVVVLLDSQSRLGPFAHTSHRERFIFTAAEVAGPPATPEGPTLVLPPGVSRGAPARAVR